METEDKRYPTVDEFLRDVSYAPVMGYVPSDFALKFVIFIKMVEGGETENKTPVVHYNMLDKFVSKSGKDCINLCHRGMAKSTLLEYLILYIAVYGILDGFGYVPYALYVSDSMDNGVKKMRTALEYRFNNSTFLKNYLQRIKFTDIRWEFIRKDNTSLVVSGHGAKTGVRGTRENNSRPVLAMLDDLISDEDARSPTVIASVEDTIYKAIDYALHPQKRKIIWNGTPFNAKDPVYKAVESGAWEVNVFPVCEQFPCTREEFRGSWEDRFDYDYVMSQYQKAKLSGKIDTFNQELMLKIMSDEDRLITDSDITWYNRKQLLENRGRFNFYITTDFATSEKTASDFSVISVWACNSNQDWFWVDGICKRQLMDANVDDLFRLVQQYKPQEVGVEISGQQKGFISWINGEMMRRNIYFTFASNNNGGEPGIRPNTNKMERFNIVVPWFKLKKIKFPIEMKMSDIIQEALEELRLANKGGFKAKKDDFIDTISMLGSLRPWFPSDEATFKLDESSGMWEMEAEERSSNLSSYIV
jgi:phage terminase large subunit-like protein